MSETPEDYQIVERPDRRLRLLGLNIDYNYPMEVIVQSADNGHAVRLHIPDSDHYIKREDGQRVKTNRAKVIGHIRGRLRTRGFALEWSRDPTSVEHVLVWAVRRIG